VTQWGLRRPAFVRLLGWLDADAAAAATKYEETRNALMKYFESRGCHTPEDLADKTIDRVAKRIEEGVELWVDEPARYFYGVASSLHPLAPRAAEDGGGAAPASAPPEDRPAARVRDQRRAARHRRGGRVVARMTDVAIRGDGAAAAVLEL
jgi:hypothetical protein